MKHNVRCTYLHECYLAEELACYGFRTDCPLYMRCNDEPCNDARFHAAMDRLIMSTKAKHERLAALKSSDKAPDNVPEPASEE